MRASYAAIPAGLPSHVRDDVASAMMLGLMEGQFSVRELPARAAEHVRAHYRMFPPKFGHLSLDAKLFDDSSTTLGDTITNDRFHF